jgi:hypothetical protein
MVTSDTTTPVSADAAAAQTWHWLSLNPGKRRTEIIYVVWFLALIPVQVLVSAHLTMAQPNDLALNAQAVAMALGTLFLPLVFRAAGDKGRPLRELYGFRMGAFLLIWGGLGGLIGTDAFYEVLHAHYAFNTELNPNGVPLFMLPMTVGVFSLYTVILGTLYRILTQLLDRTHSALVRDTWVRHGLLCAVLAVIIPLAETFAYTSSNYCFDNAVGMWGLNVLIYGSWQFAALLFYTRWDTQPEQRTPFQVVAVSAFATIGIQMILMGIITVVVAPHFVQVQHGLRQVNDWNVKNCLGPKP